MINGRTFQLFSVVFLIYIYSIGRSIWPVDGLISFVCFRHGYGVVLTWFRIKLNTLISVRAHDLWDWIIQSDAWRRSRREISWCRCCRGYPIWYSNDFANSKAFPAEARIEFHLLIDIIMKNGKSNSHSRRTNNGKFIKFMLRKFMFGRSGIGMEEINFDLYKVNYSLMMINITTESNQSFTSESEFEMGRSKKYRRISFSSSY